MKRESRIITAILIIITVLSISLPFTPAQETNPTTISSAEITVIVDNWVNHRKDNLGVEWGLSILIQTLTSQVLFDTGSTPGMLESNADALGIDLASLDAVVISHDHYDHVGGLSYITDVAPNVTVYIPANCSSLAIDLQALGLSYELVDANEEIVEGICIIKQMTSGIGPEQALAVNVEGVGMSIIVGCSHPGAENIATQACNDFNATPYMIIGGFHLFNQPSKYSSTASTLVGLGFQKIAPIHCSGGDFRTYMEENFPNEYLEAQVGYKIRLGGSRWYIWVSIGGGILLLGIGSLPIWRKIKKNRK